MRRVPTGNPTIEFIVSLQPEPAEIAKRVNRALGHFVFGPDGDSAEGGKKQPVGHANITKKTILWVEDDKLIASILGKRLISSELNLIHANDGKEAFSQLKTIVPDIIVLDLLLPGMDGFEILQKIKMDERLKKIPVMILSNLSKPGDLEKAKLLGAAKFIVKAASSLDNIIDEVKKIAHDL
jgi:CheY-like chemotaxis protein